MHEMSIALQIIEIATSAIPANLGEVTVEQVNLKVGKFSAVIPDNLRFCFKVVAAETPFANANLNIDEIPIVAQCRSCHYKWTVEKPVFICKKCESGSVEIISGRELNIESIKLAD
ncbi:hydrogenase maturation nickel metallochaperone HypA [Thermodesulfobacteriota bacterium]